jgi:hypothetical protein
MRGFNFSNFTLTAVFFLCNTQFLFCQVNQDSVMLANSDQWRVKSNKGLFGLAKPDFGTFTTIEVTRINSPVFKKKIKDSSYYGTEFSGEGTDVDFAKFVTIKKSKVYKLSLAATSDTIEALFTIASVSHEKKQTFLGKMLSKNDEGKEQVFDYNRDVPGTITSGHDTLQWSFLINNFTSGGRQTSYGTPSASLSDGYLMNGRDSIYMQIYSSFSADLVLVNQKEEHLAAIAFKQKHPEIWIRKDIPMPYQQAIAALFAVIISIKDF